MLDTPRPPTQHDPASATAATDPSPATAPHLLHPPPDVDDQQRALWALAAAAPALVADRGWGAAASTATDWRGVTTAKDGGDDEATSPATTVVALDVCEGGLTALPAAALAALPTLESLHAATNALRTLPAEAASLTRLTAINLSNNALANVPDAVCGLPRLAVLAVSLNPIAALPPALTALAPTLQWLDASECALTDAALCGGLTALTRLDLHSNRIAAVPSSFGRLHRLARLSLHSNELTAVDDAIGDATALEWLTLNSNRLATVPASMGRLPRLSRLSLHINALTSVPAALGALPLEALSLHTNRLTDVPDGLLAGLTGCVRLSLWGNRLHALPATVGRMAALQELWLNGNPDLTHLPPAIGACASLARLWVNDTRLAELPRELARCTALQELVADRTALAAVPAELAAVPALRRVQLDAGVSVPAELAGKVVVE